MIRTETQTFLICDSCGIKATTDGAAYKTYSRFHRFTGDAVEEDEHLYHHFHTIDLCNVCWNTFVKQLKHKPEPN